jgi:hypothetical protein
LCYTSAFHKNAGSKFKLGKPELLKSLTFIW